MLSISGKSPIMDAEGDCAGESGASPSWSTLTKFTLEADQSSFFMSEHSENTDLSRLLSQSWIPSTSYRISMSKPSLNEFSPSLALESWSAPNSPLILSWNNLRHDFHLLGVLKRPQTKFIASQKTLRLKVGLRLENSIGASLRDGMDHSDTGV